MADTETGLATFAATAYRAGCGMCPDFLALTVPGPVAFAVAFAMMRPNWEIGFPANNLFNPWSTVVYYLQPEVNQLAVRFVRSSFRHHSRLAHLL
jgi:hypothetical protein